MADYDNVEILLVEDSARDAEMTMRALRKHNFLNRLYWVKDGQEALDFLYCDGDYAARNPADAPQLVLLDINMPRVDGIEVLRRLKGDARTQTIPVVVMTSSDEDRDVMDSYRLGVNSYIVKPVEFGAFTETVAKIGLYWCLTNRAPQ